MICPDVTAEQAVDMGVYTVRSGVYYHRFQIACSNLANFQTRYFGLCFITYVYASCNTYHLIIDLFNRISAIGLSKTLNSESGSLIQCDQSREFIYIWSYNGKYRYHKLSQRAH